MSAFREISFAEEVPGMVINPRSAADEIAAALETRRRELSKLDLEQVRDDALSAARTGLPFFAGLRAPRRQPARWRWPLLAGLLGLAGATIGWLLLPEVRLRLTRAMANRRLARAEAREDIAPTLDAEMAPETRPYPREMAGSPA